MDPLSDILSLLKPQSYQSGAFDLGGDWSLQFPRHNGVKCYALVSGRCWLSVDGIEPPARLEAGDCFLLPRGLPFCLSSDLGLTPLDATTVFHTPPNGAIRTVNGGGKCFGVGGYFAFAGRHADLLLGMLPPVVHLRKPSDKLALRWAVERLMEELREPQPGGFLLAQQLAQMMLVLALRLHLAAGPDGGVGWLFALADEQLGRAIAAMHADPARPWTVQELADHVAMSRSSFAVKFKAAVGKTPLDYLTRWRMMLAADRLKTTDDSVGTIARSLGYDSESAFGTAFKRVMTCSPRQYGRRAAAEPQAGPRLTPATLAPL